MSTTVESEPSRATTPPAPAAANAKAPAKASPVRRLILIVVGLAMLAWAGKFIWHLYNYETTDDAYVSGRIHQVSPQLAGSVTAVLVADNQMVKAGEVLVRLDPLEYQIAVERAQAGVAQAEAQRAQAVAAVGQAESQLAEAQARLGQARAQQSQAQAQYDFAKLSQDRNIQLFNGGSGSISQQDVDATQSALRVAQSGQEAAAASLRAGEAGVASAQAARETALALGKAADAAAQTAAAGVREAQRKLSLTTILAPVDGRVGNRSVEIGDRVEAGQALMAVVEPEVWVIANFKETQLSHMKPGMPADMTVDALSGLKLEGKIDSIAPASGAQFALLPPDNATGNFTKVVQRVPVKIILDPASLQQAGGRLRPGLSVGTEVRVR